MTDTYNQLKDELSVLYPGVTDTELNEMTDGLVEFFVTGTKAFYENEKNLINGFPNTFTVVIVKQNKNRIQKFLC